MANKLLKELKDIHSGEDIWIVGGGSSMNFVDPSFFENKITMGVNQTYEKYPCDYIAGKDLNVKVRWDKTITDLKNHPKIKFLYSKYFKGYVDKGENECPDADNFYMWENGPANEQSTLDNIGTDLMICIRTTINTCMNIAAYMGAKNIIVCGNDVGKIDGKLYYDGYVKPHWPDASNWSGIERWLYLTDQNTIDIKNRIKEVYGCNIHSLNPFINFKLEGHKYEPTN